MTIKLLQGYFKPVAETRCSFTFQPYILKDLLILQWRLLHWHDLIYQKYCSSTVKGWVSDSGQRSLIVESYSQVVKYHWPWKETRQSIAFPQNRSPNL